MDVPQGGRHLLQRRHLDNGSAANGVARLFADGADICPEGFGLARGIAGSASSDTLLESPNEVLQRQAEQLANAAKFEDIQPPFARFVLAHKGLWLPEPRAKSTWRSPASVRMSRKRACNWAWLSREFFIDMRQI